MAWADLLTRTTGNNITSVDWTLLANALQERTGWVGNSTEHTKADALPALVGVNDNIQAVAVTKAMQDIVEAICASYARPELAYISGATQGSWSWSVLAQYIYDNFSGEASGIGKSGSTYDWIRRPTRDTSLLLGNPQAGDKIYYEHVRGIAYAIDQLRYLHTIWNASTLKQGDKYSGTSGYSGAQAWAAMKAATPTLSALGGERAIKCTIAGSAGNKFAADSRALMRIKMEYVWLAGHTPTAWADGIYLFKTGVGYSFDGPMKMLTAVTDSAAGCYSTGISFDDSFSVANANTWAQFSADNPDNHPKQTAYVNMLIYNPTYDGSQSADFEEAAGLAPPNMALALKPTTTYGT